MTKLELNKVTAKTASEVCTLFDLEEDAQSLLQQDLSPAEFVTILMEENKYADALHFMAYALPKREATLLACDVARSSLGDKAPKKAIKALELAEKWAHQPTEENRQPIIAAAEAVGFDNPAGLAAASASWSGGSLAPPDSPPVAPPDDLTAKAVWAAMALAAFQHEPEKAEEKYRLFLNQAIDIANGRHHDLGR